MNQKTPSQQYPSKPQTKNNRYNLKINSLGPLSQDQARLDNPSEGEELDIVAEDQSFNLNAQKDKPKAVKRAKSKALSQIDCQSQPSRETKKKYNKKENEGNILVQQARSLSVLRQICDPDCNVTIDSLGHALQKLHIQFNLRDVSDMLGLFWKLKGEDLPQNEDDRILEDEEGAVNLLTKLNQDQFKQLYKLIRKRK